MKTHTTIRSPQPRILLSGFNVYDPVTLIANAVTGYYAIPTAVDWNHDGATDLLVGEWGSTGAGHVRLFLDTGTNAPSFAFNSNVSAGSSVIALGCG